MDIGRDRKLTEVAENLIGIGLYTPAEAGRLIDVSPARLTRWLRGHDANGKHYQPMWRPQIDLGDDGLFLGFRDLMEARVAAAFIDQGLSPQRVRRAMQLAREMVDDERPLSTRSFKTDGRSVFLQVLEEDGQARLIDLFSRQYAFRDIMERSLKNIEYDNEGAPAVWWPRGRSKSVLVDPARSFGQPIEAETAVPVETLVRAVRAEGSPEAAARVWRVPLRAIKRAVAYQDAMQLRAAA